MNSFVKKGLYCALFVGGLSLLGVGAANAAETSGDSGVVSGSQVAPDLTAPVTIGGNSISLLGDATSSGTSTDAAASDAQAGTATTDGTDGIASGTQLAPDTTAPVTISGNSVSLLGDAATTGSSADGTSGTTTDATPATTDGTDGVASGTQVAPDTTAPITISGNSVSLLGDAATTGSSADGTSGTTTDATPATTDGTDGVASGTQVAPDTTAPVTISGNSVSLLGDGALDETSTGPAPDGLLGDVVSGNDGSTSVNVDPALLDGSVLPIAALSLGIAPTTAGPVLSLGTDGSVNGTDDGLAADANGALGSEAVGALGTGTTVGVDATLGNGVIADSAGAAVSTDIDALPPFTAVNASWARPAGYVSAAGMLPGAWLATTGTNAMPLIALLVLFPLVGFALLMLAHRKASHI